MENKFAVIIATYKRADGSSYSNLKRVSQFLKNQTYQNFKIFLVGDHYTDEREFNEIVKFFPENKIYNHNNSYSYRKNYFNIAYNRWTNGGALARLVGIKKAIEENFNYYLHLDDDDVWKNNHIEIINDTILKFPQVDFMVNKAIYKNITLPREFHNKNNIKIAYNNFLVKMRNSVHSSWTVNLKTLGNIFINIQEERINIIEKIRNKDLKEYQMIPLDAEILAKMTLMQKNNTIKCIYIPICTVIKRTDINIPHRE